jgi:hypothetical protein
LQTDEILLLVCQTGNANDVSRRRRLVEYNDDAMDNRTSGLLTLRHTAKFTYEESQA